MDLLSSIRKSGSRGGVNFSWDDVSTSQHRENYLGHSIMAPVGRWQKGRDLSWYVKGDNKNAVAGETADEKKARERKEEIRRIKEAEEDALARALGLPVADRGLTGSNAITVGEVIRVVKEERIGEDADGDDESGGLGKGKGFGDFVGKVQGDAEDSGFVMEREGGLAGRDGKKEVKREERSRSRERKPRRHRHRSRSGERRRHRSRSGERRKHRRRHDDREERRPRSRSVERRERRYRSRSPDRYRGRAEREDRGERRPERFRRSRSPAERDSRRDRARDVDRR